MEKVHKNDTSSNKPSSKSLSINYMEQSPDWEANTS
jgi:hypothetical protein